jgi:hypothetical protein
VQLLWQLAPPGLLLLLLCHASFQVHYAAQHLYGQYQQQVLLLCLQLLCFLPLAAAAAADACCGCCWCCCC